MPGIEYLKVLSKDQLMRCVDGLAFEWDIMFCSSCCRIVKIFNNLTECANLCASMFILCHKCQSKESVFICPYCVFVKTEQYITDYIPKEISKIIMEYNYEN